MAAITSVQKRVPVLVLFVGRAECAGFPLEPAANRSILTPRPIPLRVRIAQAHPKEKPANSRT